MDTVAGTITPTLCEWHARVKRAKALHYKRQGWLETWNRRFGVAIIVLSAISGVLAFTFLAKDSSWIGSAIEYVNGFAGAAALVLAGIQTFRDYHGEAHRHLTAAKAYNALQAELEQAKAVPHGDWDQFMTDFRRRWKEVDSVAPAIPPSYYSQ
jgi:hypothetical protein